MKVRTSSAAGKTQRALLVLASVAAVTPIALIGLYIAKLGPVTDFTISQDSERWAFFGDFLAGTVGPVLSFLAFLGVLWTIQLQNRQLALVREQGLLEELQRSVAYVAARLDQLLDDKISVTLDGKPVEMSTFRSMVVAGRCATDKTELFYTFDQSESQIFDQVTSATMRAAFVTLLYELKQLVLCLDRYVGCGGASEVKEFYIARYGLTHRQLSALFRYTGGTYPAAVKQAFAEPTRAAI